MRGMLEYTSKVKGECADDIDLNLIKDENEKKFILWCKILESTITHLQQSVDYYEEFIKYFLLDSPIFSKFNTFLTNYLTDLCIVITTDIGSLCSSDNDLSLIKFNQFCKNNLNIFKGNAASIVDECRNLTSQLSKLYKEKIFIPRNKIYCHNDEILLDDNQVKNYVENVSAQDLKTFSEISKEILSKVWYAYNGHNMCFRTKGFNDYKEIIKLLKIACD